MTEHSNVSLYCIVFRRPRIRRAVSLW